MLTEYDQQTATQQQDNKPGVSDTMQLAVKNRISPIRKSGRLARALRIEWLGQTAASLFWIASVLTYGISSTGDWLQLFAASAWLLANIATIAAAEAD